MENACAANICDLFPSLNDFELGTIENDDDLFEAIFLTNVNDSGEPFQIDNLLTQISSEKNDVNGSSQDLLTDQINSATTDVVGSSQVPARPHHVSNSERKYYEYRSKNNIASRKARLSRKAKDQESEHLAKYLRQENARLKEIIVQLTKETSELKETLTESLNKKFNGDSNL